MRRAGGGRQGTLRAAGARDMSLCPGSQAPSAPLLHAVSLALIKRRLQLHWPGKAPRPHGVLAAEAAALRLRLALKPQSGESRANPSTETLPSTESQVY